MSKSIKYNLGLSVVTLIGQIISGSAIVIYLAKYLNKLDFGIFTFLFSFSGILSVVAEFGFSLMVQKDIPQNRFEIKEYVNNVLFQKVLYSILTIFLGLAYLYFFFDEKILLYGVYFILFAIVVSFVMFFHSLFRSINSFGKETISTNLYSISLIILLAICIYFNLSLQGIILCFVIARIIQLIYCLLEVYKNNLLVDISKCYRKDIQKYLWFNSPSYGFFYIFGILYFNIDTQLLGVFFREEIVAEYQSYFRIITLLLVFSDLLVGVLSPYLSRLYKENKGIFKKYLFLFNKVFVFIAFSLSLGVLVYSDVIYRVVFNEHYNYDSNIIRMLSGMMFFRIVTSPYAISFTLANYQRIRLIIVVLSFTISLLIGLVFIPKLGSYGASISSYITVASLFVMYLYMSKKLLGAFFFNRNMFLALIFFYGYMMVDFYIGLSAYVSSILYVILMGIVWMLLFNRVDLLEIRKILNKK